LCDFPRKFSTREEISFQADKGEVASAVEIRTDQLSVVANGSTCGQKEEKARIELCILIDIFVYIMKKTCKKLANVAAERGAQTDLR
jgi:hypothetical protein